MIMNSSLSVASSREVEREGMFGRTLISILFFCEALVIGFNLWEIVMKDLKIKKAVDPSLSPCHDASSEPLTLLSIALLLPCSVPVLNHWPFISALLQYASSEPLARLLAPRPSYVRSAYATFAPSVRARWLLDDGDLGYPC